MAATITKQILRLPVPPFMVFSKNVGSHLFKKRYHVHGMYFGSYCTCEKREHVNETRPRRESKFLCHFNPITIVNEPLYKPSLSLYVRHQSNDAFDRDNQDSNKRKLKPVFIALPNPFKVLRNWVFGVIIRAYFDPEFSFKDFTEGAKQVRLRMNRPDPGLTFCRVMPKLNKAKVFCLRLRCDTWIHD